MVGKHLVDMCLDKGYYVRRQIFVMIIVCIYVKNFEFYQADLRDFDDCKNVVRYDAVFQVAGLKVHQKRQNNQTITLHQC